MGEKLPNGQSPRALGNLPLAASDTSHRGHTSGGELRWDPRDGAPLDAVVASAQQRWALATRSSTLIVASQIRPVPSREAEAILLPSGDHDTLSTPLR